MRLADAASSSSQDIQPADSLDSPKPGVPELPRHGNQVTPFPKDDPGAAHGSVERTADDGGGSGFGPLLGRIFQAIGLLLGAGATTASPFRNLDHASANDTGPVRDAIEGAPTRTEEPPTEVEEEEPSSEDATPSDEGTGDLLGPAREDERFA
jgi:hypothetical protein